MVIFRKCLCYVAIVALLILQLVGSVSAWQGECIHFSKIRWSPDSRFLVVDAKMDSLDTCCIPEKILQYDMFTGRISTLNPTVEKFLLPPSRRFVAFADYFGLYILRNREQKPRSTPCQVLFSPQLQGQTFTLQGFLEQEARLVYSFINRNTNDIRTQHCKIFVDSACARHGEPIEISAEEAAGAQFAEISPSDSALYRSVQWKLPNWVTKAVLQPQYAIRLKTSFDLAELTALADSVKHARLKPDTWIRPSPKILQTQELLHNPTKIPIEFVLECGPFFRLAEAESSLANLKNKFGVIGVITDYSEEGLDRYNFAPSPDGRWIAFIQTYWGFSPFYRAKEIWLIDRKTGLEKKVIDRIANF